MEDSEVQHCLTPVVTFEDMKNTIYGRGEDVELEFHLKDRHLVMDSEIRIYRHGWSDLADSVLNLPSSLWLQKDCRDTFAVHFNVDLLNLNGIYQACCVSEGKILGRSALFRSPSSESTGSDDGFELIVPKPWEVRDKEAIGQELELHKSRCRHLLAHTETLHSNIKAMNSHLMEEKVYSKELQNTVRHLVEEKERAAQETADLHRRLAEAQAALSEKDSEVKSLKEAVREKDNKLAALKSEMALKVGILEEERLSLLRQVKENIQCHKKFKEEYELSQLHLENAKERLEAHESTKQLLHAELVAMKEFKTEMSAKLVALTTENEELNNALERLSIKSEVNTSSPEILELQKKVQELVARLNAAAAEYTKLYKQIKGQEKVLLHFSCLEKEGTISAGVLQEEGQCLPKASTTTQSCKACPPTTSRIFQPGTKTDSCCIRGAKDGSDLHRLLPSRDRSKGAPSAFPCGKWSSLRRAGHVSGALCGAGKRLRCSLKERRSSLPLLSSTLSRASCPVKKLECMAASAEATTRQSRPGTKGANCAQTKDSNFVAIQMPDLSNEDFCQRIPREMMTCAFCLKEFPDVEQHLRDAHGQQPCPVCGQLFEVFLPPTYLEIHVENHFTPELQEHAAH